MIEDKTIVVDSLIELLNLTEQKGNIQGVKMYSHFSTALSVVTSEIEMKWVLSNLYRQLIGIEAHGSISKEEHDLFMVIRNVCVRYI